MWNWVSYDQACAVEPADRTQMIHFALWLGVLQKVTMSWLSRTGEVDEMWRLLSAVKGLKGSGMN